MSTSPVKPQITWDYGTGYDLFTSLYVIHNPGEVGLRATWAAGVRSRLPSYMREMLEEILIHFCMPAHWIYSLQQPKDGLTVIRALEKMPPQNIIHDLYIAPGSHAPEDLIYDSIWERGSWNEEDLGKISECCSGLFTKGNKPTKRKRLVAWLDWWTKPEEFGNLYKRVIAEYYETFYREEERRISADLQEGYEAAKELEKNLTVEDLFEELTHGLNCEEFLKLDSVILVPSYWSSPRVFHCNLGKGKRIILFGAKPRDATLVPGEPVPDSLSVALNTLADHTRLRILKLLISSPRTQTEIAKELRLRTPTISHHMKALRVAGLISIATSEKDESRYSTRVSSIEDLCRAIKDFLAIPRL